MNFDKIQLIVLKIMVFFTPLFFLSFSPLQFGMDNYSKIVFLSFFLFLILALFFYNIYQSKQLRIKRSPLDLFLLGFLFYVLFVSLFSMNKTNTLFGSLSITELPLVSLFVFILFYFYFYNYLDSGKKIVALLRYLYASLSLTVVLAFVDIFILKPGHIFASLKMAFGNFEDLANLLVFFMILSLSLVSFEALKEKFFVIKRAKLLVGILNFLALILIIKINSLFAWWLFLLGMACVAFVRFRYRDRQASPGQKFWKKKRPLFVPILLLLISINYLLNFYLYWGIAEQTNRINKYRQLNHSYSIELSLDSVKNNLFGIGLENIDYAYSKYRDSENNEASVWTFRYNRVASLFYYLSISLGVFGVLIFLALCLYIFFLVFKKIFTSKESVDSNFWDIALSPLLFVLIASFFFYTTTTVSLFIFIFVVATVFRSSQSEEAFVYDFDLNDKDKHLNFGLFSSFVLIIMFVILSFQFKYFLADANFARAERQESQVDRALSISPRFDFNLEKANLFLTKYHEAIKSQDGKALDYQLGAIDQATKLKLAGTNSVVAQESGAMIFRDFSSGADGNNIHALEGFEKAFELEPSNPVLATALGQAYINKGDFSEAKKYFVEALSLKPDYLLAKLNLAKVEARLGNKEEAIVKLKELATESNRAEAYYELGLVYFNDDSFEEAKKAFSSATTLSPRYANALYGLALSLENLGDIEGALSYLKNIQRMNPGNMEVNEKIEFLKEKL